MMNIREFCVYSTPDRYSTVLFCIDTSPLLYCSALRQVLNCPVVNWYRYSTVLFYIDTSTLLYYSALIQVPNCPVVNWYRYSNVLFCIDTGTLLYCSALIQVLYWIDTDSFFLHWYRYLLNLYRYHWYRYHNVLYSLPRGADRGRDNSQTVSGLRVRGWEVWTTLYSALQYTTF